MTRGGQSAIVGRATWPGALFRRALASDYFVLGLCVAYALALAPIAPGFATLDNAGNVLATYLPLLLVALGQTLVLIVGGIDLSVTAVIGLTSIVGALAINGDTGWLAGSPLAAPAGVLIMLLLGAAIGAAHGLAITRLRMPAFIVTLAGMMAFSGLAVWLTKSESIYRLPATFNALGGRTYAAFAITSVCAVLVHLLLSRSLFGRWLYAAGHNSRAARISGVPVDGVTIAAYVACGTLAALASVLYTGQAETGSPVLGQRILIDVVGATVIGGTSLLGGRGKVVWTCFGVLLLKLIDNSLNLLGLSIFAITMAKGGVILVAAVLDSMRHQLSETRA